MTARYRSTSLRTRYASSRRRCPTSFSSPRREWLSFGKLRRCSVSDLIRSVRSAICTSGDPVSPSCVAYSSTIALFASLASGTFGDEFGASNAPYPDAPLDVTAPGEESGTFDSFIEIALEDIADGREQDATTRPDYQASPDDNVIVEGISGSDTSLGWVGYAFASENSDVIKALAVDGGDGCVTPTDETISDGSYPIARSLWIYPSLTALEGNTALEAFVDFYMSDEGFASVTEVGYVSLPEDRIEATRTAWEERRAGKFTD